MEHIYRGILFIFDRHHLEHAGFICAKAQSCVVVGGSRSSGDRNVTISYFNFYDFLFFIFVTMFLLNLFLSSLRVMPTQDLPVLEVQVVFHRPQGGFLEEGQWIVCLNFSLYYMLKH